ncbi:MAG: integration host factor subunit beta [Flavobacteriales bacterium]|nr:integration host factor subunit beta [Flavobacteriales bacterium]
MTKAELVSKISINTGVEKVIAMAVIESMMEEIKVNIAQNESIFLRGFGTFKAKKRAKKTGRNIKKNTTIIIPEHHIPAFKPAKSFVKEVKENIK